MHGATCSAALSEAQAKVTGDHQRRKRLFWKVLRLGLRHISSYFDFQSTAIRREASSLDSPGSYSVAAISASRAGYWDRLEDRRSWQFVPPSRTATRRRPFQVDGLLGGPNAPHSIEMH